MDTVCFLLLPLNILLPLKNCFSTKKNYILDNIVFPPLTRCRLTTSTIDFPPNFGQRGLEEREKERVKENMFY